MLVIDSYNGLELTSHWVEKLIIQLNKDLALTGFDKEFNPKSTLEDFKEASVSFFEELLATNSQQLYNLLSLHNYTTNFQL